MPNYDDYQADAYKSWACTNRYEHHSGTIALPVALSDAHIAAGESPVVVVRSHPSHRIRHVVFEVVKERTPPVIPSPTDSGPFKFLGGYVEFPTPVGSTTMDSVQYSAAGELVFVEDNRDSPNDGWILGVPPWQSEMQAVQAQIGAASPGGLQGALPEAGYDVLVGVRQSQSFSSTSYGATYNSISYFPGRFANEELVAGGPTTPYTIPGIG